MYHGNKCQLLSSETPDRHFYVGGGAGVGTDDISYISNVSIAYTGKMIVQTLPLASSL